MKIEKISPSVLFCTEIKYKIPLLIVSDIHFDSLNCDHDSLKAHFDQIQKMNGKILIIGDIFDVMGTWKDPRSRPNEINPAYIQKGRAYLDLVVEDCFEFLKPYKDNILIISEGNHESNIRRRHDTDVLDRLIFLLNTLPGSEVHKGKYSGWVKFSLNRNDKLYSSFMVAYHHGGGGNAKRSKGILYSQLDTMEYPDANLIVSGHDHNKIYDPSNVRRRIDIRTGKTYHDTVHWIKTGSYKRSSDTDGWEVQKKFTPKKLGGWFVELEHKRLRKYKDGKEIESSCFVEPKIYEAVPVR